MSARQTVALTLLGALAFGGLSLVPTQGLAQSRQLFPKSCRSQQATGAVVGAIVGGLIGRSVADDDDRNTGTAVGALVGAFAGSQIAKTTSRCEQEIAVGLAQRTAATGLPQAVVAPDTERAVSTQVAGAAFVDGKNRRCKPVSVQVGAEAASEPIIMCEVAPGDWRPADSA